MQGTEVCGEGVSMVQSGRPGLTWKCYRCCFTCGGAVKPTCVCVTININSDYILQLLLLFSVKLSSPIFRPKISSHLTLVLYGFSLLSQFLKPFAFDETAFSTHFWLKSPKYGWLITKNFISTGDLDLKIDFTDVIQAFRIIDPINLRQQQSTASG
jgi:hypothetical protein